MTIEFATVAAIISGMILAVGVYLGRHAPMVEHPPVSFSPWWLVVLAAATLWSAAALGVPVPPRVLIGAGVFALVGPLAVMLAREVIGK